MGTSSNEARAPLSSIELLPLVRTYGAEHISPDKKFLQIRLNNEAFDLTLTNVGGADTPVHIAWLDTHPPDSNHPDVDPRLPHASAVERAHLIATMESYQHFNFTTIITPYSSKSIPAIDETVWIASHTLQRDLQLIILPGGRNEQQVVQESIIPPISYTNVTCKEGEHKFIGITKEGLELIQKRNPKGKGILFLDDVYTTGGTDFGMQMVMNTIFDLPEQTRHPLVVLATESVYGKPYTPPSHVFSRIHLPEFVGGLPHVA